MATYRITTGTYNTSDWRLVAQYKKECWWRKRIAKMLVGKWTVDRAIELGWFDRNGKIYRLRAWDETD